MYFNIDVSLRKVKIHFFYLSVSKTLQIWQYFIKMTNQNTLLNMFCRYFKTSNLVVQCHNIFITCLCQYSFFFQSYYNFSESTMYSSYIFEIQNETSSKVIRGNNLFVEPYQELWKKILGTILHVLQILAAFVILILIR